MARIHHRRQRGMSLLESLIALVIFSLGTLALVGMYGRALATATDAQMRADAAAYASDMINQIWLGVERDNLGQVKPASLSQFRYGTAQSLANASPRTALCDEIRGGDTGSPATSAWLKRIAGVSTNANGQTVTDTRSALPAAKALVAIDTGAENRVAIVLCWKNPRDQEFKIHETTAFIN